MTQNITGIILETIIRTALKQIKADSERNIRNVVDMAVEFSKGRFQKYFLTSVQALLKNKNSCYYKLIPDLIHHVDEERIVTFGMNIGYNSCTIGAGRIREIEASEHYNIPWSISLEMNGYVYAENKFAYHTLIEQGIQLGIYTWNIHSLGQLQTILELAKSFPECSFPIFCSPSEISPELLDEVNNINNIMFVIHYSEHIEDACALLRNRKQLYSVSYAKQNISNSTIEDILTDTENMHCLFTIFDTETPDSLENRSAFYQYIQQVRKEQKYQTIPFDMLQDNLCIDSIISDDACSFGFNLDGICYSIHNRILHKELNFYDYKLSEILKEIAPKKYI